MSDWRDYTLLYRDRGVSCYWYRTSLYKTLRFDVVLRHKLRREHSSSTALIARLCERGTRQLPDMRSLNRYIDHLYGAYYSAEVERLGDQQLIHLCLEVLDERFVSGSKDQSIVQRGLDLMGQVLGDPLLEGRGFKRSYLEEEKRALAAQIESLYNDKLGYAQWRCVEELGRGTAFGLSHLGNPSDFEAIDAEELWAFQQKMLSNSAIDIFVSGAIDENKALELCRHFWAWERQVEQEVFSVAVPAVRAHPRFHYEYQNIIQGKLVCGYATGTGLANGDYAALVLFNLLWAGDSQAVLFRKLREELGLCYYIESHLDPIAGFIFLTAAIDGRNYAPLLQCVEVELEKMRRGQIATVDIQNAQKLLISRLTAMGDDREALMRLEMRREVTGVALSRALLLQRLREVDGDRLRAIANKVQLQTAYFLHGERGAERRRA